MRLNAVLRSIVVCLLVPGFVFSICADEKRSKTANTDTNHSVVVCFGDSITRRGYPESLEKMLGVSVSNAGVNGNTTRQALARLQRDVLSKKPKVVVIFFGANDSRQDAPKTQVSVSEYATNLTKIVEQCQAIGAKVVLGTMPPIVPEPYFQRHPKETYDAVGGFEKHIQTYYEAALKVARETKATSLNLHVLLQKTPQWVSPDGVHPSPEGNEIIAKLVADSVQPLLQLKR